MSSMMIVRGFALVLAGAWLAGTPIATSAKPPASTPGSEPYQTTVYGTFGSGGSPYGGQFFGPDPIPANRRLVIEFVSASITVPTGSDPLLTLHSLVGGRSSPFILPLTYIGPAANGDEYRVTMMVRLYVDGNGVNGPEVECLKSVSGPGSSCTVDISGYLIEK